MITSIETGSPADEAQLLTGDIIIAIDGTPVTGVDLATWIMHGELPLTVNAVTITQTAPTSRSVTTSGSSAFTDQLNTSGNTGPVTFTTTSANPAFTVASRRPNRRTRRGPRLGLSSEQL